MMDFDKAFRETPDSFSRGISAHLRALQRKEEAIVKKKLSVGLIIAIMLMLAAVTALAVALLTSREIVEEHGLPIASQSEGDVYSAEETNFLLDLAKENGIVLSETGMASIRAFLELGKGYYKEEMLMELAKAEFGQDTAYWSPEENKWFSDVCAAIGFTDQPHSALPGDNERES